MLPRVASVIQGTLAWPCVLAAFSLSSASSAALTDGWSAGLLRNHFQNTTAHTTPSDAKIWNAVRQLTNDITATTSTGVNAPPQRAPIHISACARVRSARGSH